MNIYKFKFMNKLYFGSITQNKKKIKIIKNPFNKNKLSVGKSIDINKVKFVTPLDPTKILCVALNFKGITNYDKKKEPLIFLKSSNSLTIKNKIKIDLTKTTWCEPEIGIVIKNKIDKKTKNFKNKILGFIIANDITSKNIYGRDHHLLLSKSLDNYCPISSFINTSFNFQNKNIFGYFDNQLLRKGNTKEIHWPPEKILKNISKKITLYPQDIILTGSPPRIMDRKFIKKGTKFKIHIDKLGTMINYF